MNSIIEQLFVKGGVDSSQVFWGNSLLEYGVALMFFVGLTVVFKIGQVLILARLARLAKKTKTDVDDTLIRIVESVQPQFYGFLAFFLSLQILSLHMWFDRTLTAALLIFAVYQVVKAVGILIDYIGEKKLKREQEQGGDVDPGSKAAIQLIQSIAKAILWILGLLLILSNLGVEVTSLIAGLGIGGIAIAFALQSILGDLFSSFTIYFDKPFKVGDYIVVGDVSGTVEHVGIKSTRIRALQGEEIILSNTDLTSARIHNYKRMEKRRVAFTFGVVYETPIEKLKKIPTIVRNVFDSVDNVDLDRVHFKKLGDFSLDFEVVFLVLSSEYAEYADIQQNVNFALMEAFAKENIVFAYPTQTVYVAK